jgi:hypothetical protein
MAARARAIAGIVVAAIAAGACGSTPPITSSTPAGTVAPGDVTTAYLTPSPPPVDISNAPARGP